MAGNFQSGTGLKRVRGLGSAKSGVHHWWLQRVTAVGNLLLLAWFIISLILLPDLRHASVVAWIANPLVAVPLTMLIAISFWHARLGMQVLIEDYVPAEGTKFMLLLMSSFFLLGAGALAIFSVLSIAFGA